MKRYVVMLDAPGTAEQVKKFADSLSVIKDGAKLGWWHWLSNAWLVHDIKGNRTLDEIRNLTKEAFPGVVFIVLELNGADDSWAGFGYNTKEKNMFDWLHLNWKGDPAPPKLR